MEKTSSDKNISFSSVQTQRQLRLEKAQKLREIGHDPYTPYSKRDFTLGFVKFWFDFVHKFDHQKVYNYIGLEDLFYLEYFLDLVLFPQSLLEKAEEHLHLRSILRESGFIEDVSTFQDEFDQEILNEARLLFPDLSSYTDDIKWKYKSEYVFIDDEDDANIFLSLNPNQEVTLAGRIKSKRSSGKIAFLTMEDEFCPEGFQFILKKDDLTQEDKADEEITFDNFQKLIDEGDYIQATGVLDYSQRGEASLFVKKVRILTKALRPLPEKIDYQNLEHRYLHRVEDFKYNTKDDKGLTSRDIVYLKNKYWSIWREEMLREGFLEVECPIFEDIPGGADTKPFTTFYNELDQEMYLRISLELPLKKLIAGGFEKVFEIGRIFRNEGASPQHLQEFTFIEWYWAYTDYNDAMRFVARVYKRMAKEFLGSMKQIDYYGNDIDWGEWSSHQECQKNGWENIDGWPAIKYYDAIRYYSKKYYPKGQIDLENKTYEELLRIAKDNEIEVEKGIGLHNLVDKIYKKVCRVYIQNPIFLYHQPVFLEPLAKRDPKNPNFVHRWQVVVGTAEMGKAFSELNDPLDQYERLLEQQKAKDGGDEEAQMMNMPYIEAMEYGMPPLSGFGVSERLVSFFLGKNIKECVTFPAIRAEEENQKTITLCGSMVFKDKMLELKTKLEKIGYQVLLPNLEEVTDYSKLSKIDSIKIKNKLIKEHMTKINQGNKILIINETKNGKTNYIGANTFLEMGFAMQANKPIYLLNGLPTDQDNIVEIEGMEPVELKGDLKNLDL